MIESRKAANLLHSVNMAWRCLETDMRGSSLGDIIDWADIVESRKPILRQVFERRSDNDVRPKGFHVIDKPKDSINVRPLTRFSIDDHLIYASLVTQIARNIDRTLNRRAVYSHRWRLNDTGMWNPIRSWVRMQRRARWKIQRNPKLFLAKTDVVAFYESVDLDTLVADVDSLGLEGYNSSPLRDFLDGFQSNTHAWGLPQGPEVSGILANLYLRPVDNFLTRHRFSYMRFSDDIDIFGQNWSELRSIIHEINRIMRSRRLSMSGSKTRIYDSIGAKGIIEDSEKSAIQYMIKIGDRRAVPEVKRFFDNTIRQDSPTLRDIRFSLFRLGEMGDPHALKWCLEALEQFPHAAKDIFDYLYKFPMLTPVIGQFLARLIRNASRLNSPALDRQIFRYFLAREIKDSHLQALAWEIIEDRQHESILREFSARYAGQMSRPGDGQRFISIFEGEIDTFVRRALLVAAYESKYCPKKLLTSLASERSEIRWTAMYLSRNPLVPLPRSEE